MIRFVFVIVSMLTVKTFLFAADDLMPDNFFVSSIGIAKGISDTVPEIESRKWTTNKEQKIRDQLFRVFTEYYPSLFSPFNYEKLNEFFVDQGTPSVLIGKKIVDDPATGREEFKYSWQTKQWWLASLKKVAEQLHRQFKVKVAIIGVFNDNLDPDRYWVALKQNWKTVDSIGRVVYQDNSCLFFKADFDSLDISFNIRQYYYMPIYEYNYDDQTTGMKKHEKFVRDIKMNFMNNFAGIDSSLKRVMIKFVEDKIHP